jgi:hypothetical protein
VAPGTTVVGDTLAVETPVGESPAVADRYPPLGTPSPTWTGLRSLVLPGWGQARNGSWLKAGLFLGGYSFLVGTAVKANQDRQDAKGQLNAAQTPEDEEYWDGEIERLGDKRNTFIWFAGLTAFLSFADAYVDAHLKNFDDRIDADVAAFPDGEGGLGWAFRVTLPIEEGPR